MESNDSPEIADRWEKSDIPASLRGPEQTQTRTKKQSRCLRRSLKHSNFRHCNCRSRSCHSCPLYRNVFFFFFVLFLTLFLCFQLSATASSSTLGSSDDHHFDYSGCYSLCVLVFLCFHASDCYRGASIKSRSFWKGRHGTF